MSNNSIQTIAKGSFKMSANSLRVFTLSNGKLKYLPDVLQDLTALEVCIIVIVSLLFIKDILAMFKVLTVNN